MYELVGGRNSPLPVLGFERPRLPGLPDRPTPYCYSGPVTCPECGGSHPQHQCPVARQPPRPVSTGRLVPGTVLGGKYQITRELGRGAMGVVYEASHVSLGRKVAVKTLLEEVRTDAQMGERFQREARAASAIGHPNIIDVFDLGRTEDGILFMVMELLDGRSLGDLLKETPKLPIPLAVQLMGQILSGLSAAHKQGIVHRDLKPDNVFVINDDERSNFIKIVDFGISKVLAPNHSAIAATVKGTGTMVGSILGTPLYMSPEQAIGQVTAIDHRTDIYSAGVVLYEMLCGRTPFVGESYAQIFGSLIEGEYPQPRSLRPEISRELEGAIACAIDRNMDRRFASAAAMRTAILGTPVEVTAEPVLLSPAFGAPLSAGPATEAAAMPPVALLQEPEPSVGRVGKSADPFAPPPDDEQVPVLADEDHPLRARNGSAHVVRGPAEPEARPTPAHEPCAEGGHLERENEVPARRNVGRIAIITASLLLVTALALRIGYGYLRGEATQATAGRSEASIIQLVVEPNHAAVQVDHVPTAARELSLDPGVRHELNVTASGRLTRRFGIEANKATTLTVRLRRQIPLPLPGEPTALAAELAAEYPDTPRSTAEIDRAFDSLDRYGDCLTLISDLSTDAKRAMRLRLRKEELGLCQKSIADAAAGEPIVPELQTAAESFLRAIQNAQHSDALARLAATFRAEFLTAQTAWQLEDLSREGKDDGQTALWHMRRVSLAAQAWRRSLRTPMQDVRASKLRAYEQALVELARTATADVNHVAGASDFLRVSRALSALSTNAKVGEFAVLDGCRQLISAFNALVDSSPGRMSGKR